jgi:hypothetical protein|tara:strand:- start:3181 stop:3387 length:207 start_codon:yes stop_codon:yes gene_type:complete
MKIRDLISETATGGGTSAGSVTSVAGSTGGVISRNMYNADGTMKNALDVGVLLAGINPTKKKTSKRTK